MMSKSKQLIPHEKTQQAIALSIAEVISKQSRNAALSEAPYARAFFAKFMGCRTPKRHELNQFCSNPHKSSTDIIKLIDRFIRTNGEYDYQLNDSFKHKAFPSMFVSQEVRFYSRIDMNLQKQNNISSKKEDEHSKHADEKYNELLSLNNKELGRWVNDNEDVLSELELKIGLQKWFEANEKSDWSFRDLYNDCRPSAIAYDLSFDD